MNTETIKVGDKVRIKALSQSKVWEKCPLKVGGIYKITSIRSTMLADEMLVYEIYANGYYWCFDLDQIELVK